MANKEVEQAAAFLRERKIPLTEANTRLRMAGMVYDLSRARSDPGHPLFDDEGFGYLHVPYRHEADEWEEEPLADVVFRARYKGRRKGLIGAMPVKDEAGKWWWILRRAAVEDK